MVANVRKRSAPSVESLRKWNVWLAVLYAVQAVGVLVVGSTQLAPLTTSFLTIDSLLSTTTGSVVLAPASHHLFDINILYITFAVLAVLAAMHASQAMWLRARYESQLKEGYNNLRWAAYGLTASLTFIILAMMVGMSDVSTLLLLLVLSVVLHTLCAWAERVAGQRGRVKNSAGFGFVLLVLCGLAMWSVVGIYLAGASVYGAGHISARVYWLALTAGLTAFSFALSLWSQLAKPRAGQDYRFSERRYLILTFVTTSLLMWQIVAGTIQ